MWREMEPDVFAQGVFVSLQLDVSLECEWARLGGID